MISVLCIAAGGQGEDRGRGEEDRGQGGQGTGHCPAGIFKNIISNVTKNEEAGHGPIPCHFSKRAY